VTFTDANVLVYAAADGSPLLDRARAALAGAAADGAVTISRQSLARIAFCGDLAADLGEALTLAQAIGEIPRRSFGRGGPFGLGPARQC
jgi:predicted nucleic acid-binding protein